MSTSTDDPLTSRERLSRGLKYSMIGPVEVTRGTVGLGMSSAALSASWIGRQVREAQARARPEPEPAPRCRRPLLYVLIGAAVLAVGGVTFSIVRRSMRPEPSPLPPSVAVDPKP